MKLPSKKDSTVKTKRNRKLEYPYENLADNSICSRDKELLDQLRPKKILYILSNKELFSKEELTKSSKILTSGPDDDMEDVIKGILR